MIFLIIALVLAAAGGVLFFRLKSGKKADDFREVKPTAVKEVPEILLPDSMDPATCGEASEEVEEESDSVSIQISVHAPYPVLEDITLDVEEDLKTLITALPKLPTVAFDVLSILSKHGTGSREIAKIIERDQSTAARLLRWVNSSLFGLDGKVTSLQRAVTLLGMDTIRTLVLEDSLERNSNFTGTVWLSPEMVWRHVAAVSACSKYFAKSVRGVEPDVAATAGLLHDIGLILMLITERRGLDEIGEVCKTKKIPPIEGESDTLGFNHQILGEVFCNAWGLPDEISKSIGRHHSPLLEPFNPLAALLWLADYAVSRLGFECPEGFIPDADPAEVDELLSRLGLKPPVEHYITEGLVREMLNSTKYWASKKAKSSAVGTA